MMKITDREREDCKRFADAMEKGWEMVGHRQSKYDLFEFPDAGGRAVSAVSELAAGRRVKACALGCVELACNRTHDLKKPQILYAMQYGSRIEQDNLVLTIPAIIERVRNIGGTDER